MSLFDRLINEVDQGLKVLMNVRTSPKRVSPAHQHHDNEFTPTEQKRTEGYMRVDHTGEICAQALYRGQALLAKDPKTRQYLLDAAAEENDHLVWCQERLNDLNTHASFLNPLWYAGSFAIGVTAAAFGDPISLGFVAETENQVMRHLDEHLDTLPEQDHKSRAILKQMHEDEMTHAQNAIDGGAKELPKIVQGIMRLQSQLMTKTAYFI